MASPGPLQRIAPLRPDAWSIAATAVGVLPAVLFLVFAGDDGARMIREYPLVALAALAVGATVFVAIRRRRARASLIVAD